MPHAQKSGESSNFAPSSVSLAAFERSLARSPRPERSKQVDEEVAQKMKQVEAGKVLHGPLGEAVLPLKSPFHGSGG